MKILFFGDIVGRPGRQAIKKLLPEFKKKYEPDLVIANGENLSHGKGITKESINEMIGAGIDWLTLGNHAFKSKEATSLLEDKKMPIIRPANWSPGVPGRGWVEIALRSKKIILINLVGRVFMQEQLESPFVAVDKILEDYSLKKESGKERVSAIIVDWHVEATSEKVVLGWYLDGKVSAIFGTHTHIGTDDWRVLPGGTAYVSDVGMSGVQNSVLGIDKEIILKRFLTQLPYHMEVAQGAVLVEAMLVSLDEKTGLAQNIEKIKELVEID